MAIQVGALQARNNLVDVVDPIAARANMGLGALATVTSLGNGLVLTTNTLTITGPVARVVVAAGGITALPTDNFIVVRKTVGAPTAVTLEVTPIAGTSHVIKDGKGDASVNNITISPASGTIDGVANFILNINRSAVTLMFDGTEWSVI